MRSVVTCNIPICTSFIFPTFNSFWSFLSIFQEYYGKDDSEAVAKVKDVYDELQLQKLYKTYEDEAYTEIVKQINGLSSLNPDIFFSFLGKIYKRES